MFTPELMTGSGLTVQVTKDEECQEGICSHLPAPWLSSALSSPYFLAVQPGASCLASLCRCVLNLQNGHRQSAFLVIWLAQGSHEIVEERVKNYRRPQSMVAIMSIIIEQMHLLCLNWSGYALHNSRDAIPGVGRGRGGT